MAKNSEATLLLRIKEAGSEALTKVKEGFEEVSKKAAIAGAAIAGFLGLSVKAYADAQEASNMLTQAIKNQGLDVETLKARYDELAEAIQKKSKYDDDEITAALASGQAMAGNIELTNALIQATVDYAAATGTDLNAAFEKVGKSIGTTTNALSREGIELDTAASKTDKMADVTAILTQKFGGMAEASTKGLGSIAKLSNAVGGLAEAIGESLAPFVEDAARGLLDFIDAAKKHDEIIKYGSIVAAVAASVLGLVGVLPTLAKGFSAVLSPIGLVSAAIVALGTAWLTNTKEIQERTFGVFRAITDLWEAFSADAVKIFGGIGDLISGAFKLDFDQIKRGIDTITAATKTSMVDLSRSYEDGFDARKQALSDALRHQEDSEKKAVKVAVQTASTMSKLKAAEINKEEEQLELDRIKRDKAAYDARMSVAKDEENYRRGVTEDLKKQLEETQRRQQEVVGAVASAAQSGAEGLAKHFIAKIPVVGAVISGMFELLSQDTDKFLEQTKQMFASTDLLFGMMKNADVLFANLTDALAELSKSMNDHFPELVEKIVDTILANLPEMIADILSTALGDVQMIPRIVEAVLRGSLSGTIKAFGNLGDILKTALDKSFVDLLNVAETIAGAFQIFKGGDDAGGGILKKIGVKFNEGGIVPGTPIQKFASGGTVDTVPAMLTPGEFVVNAGASARNLNLLKSINSGGSGGGMSPTINIVVNGGFLGDPASARQFARAVDSELLKLRQSNQSVAFDTATF